MQQAASGLERGMALATDAAVQRVSRGNPAPHTTPSLPGEPPRVRTGALRASLGHEVHVEGDVLIGRLGVREGPASRYARALEFGFEGLVVVPGHTRRDAYGNEVLVRTHVRPMRLAARPYLRPTLGEQQATILRTTFEAIR
ncbi:MAG TPA: hypothetical protein PKA98_19795 [Acidimicrobiales bacterium]|nr:hypothetical protein [Acidimicrobiales bacterium]